MINRQRQAVKTVFYFLIAFALYSYVMNTIGCFEAFLESFDLPELTSKVLPSNFDFVRWTMFILFLSLILHWTSLVLWFFLDNKAINIIATCLGGFVILNLLVYLFLTIKFIRVDGSLNNDMFQLMITYRAALIDTLVPACILSLTTLLYSVNYKKLARANFN